ncbi:MAG: acyl-CoA dehydrogenase family protein, partial [Syntrophothermus sp.]
METMETAFIDELTENQIAIRNTLKDFAQKNILSHIMEYDEKQEFPISIFKKLGEMGFLGILVPEEFDGAGLGYIDFALIVEEIAKVDPSVALSVAAHNGLCTNHINLFGSQNQKEKYVSKLAAGEFIGAWGLTESSSGSDSASMQTTAVKDDDGYILNGNKTFTTHGTVGDVYVVMAVTDKEKKKKGISAFIIDKGTPGLTALKKENKLGMRASDTTQIIFDNCKIPIDNLIGNEGEGFKQAMKVLEGGRISIAALSIGLAEGALNASLKYSKERHQFGKPLNDFQAIQFKLAEMATNIEAAKMLTYRAANMKDKGKDINKPAAIAKLFASEMAERCASEAVQIHGGYGF